MESQATADNEGVPAITVIVPAFNEASSLAETLDSLTRQTLLPAEVIVVDDCSTDGTGAVAASRSVKVLRPPANTGSKAGAQSFALPHVTTPLVVAVDADTTLAHDALERLSASFDDPAVVAACGFVLPRQVESIWERGRYVEYLFAFTFYKQVQDFYGSPLIASGCFSMYRTDALRAAGGWSNRTLAEDMDLTWTFYSQGYRVRFDPAALALPIEPHSFHHLRAQLRRWSHGFVQNLRLHWRDVLEVPFLRSAVGVALWDAAIASVAFLLVLPMLAIATRQAWLLLGYVIDLPAILVPVIWACRTRGDLTRGLTSLPAFFVLRTVNAAFFVHALWRELVVGRPLLTYEKGH